MITIQTADALLLVDVQNDFLPGGALGVPHGDQILPVIRNYIAKFVRGSGRLFATQDWHPRHHCSFRPQGGPWPVHCVAETRGAAIADEVALPTSAAIIHKGTSIDKDAYSGFQDTTLEAELKQLGVQRLFIGGLATDYCVLNTVKDALGLGYPVFLLTDAIRAVDKTTGDGRTAEREMMRLGAVPTTIEDVSG